MLRQIKTKGIRQAALLEKKKWIKGMKFLLCTFKETRLINYRSLTTEEKSYSVDRDHLTLCWWCVPYFSRVLFVMWFDFCPTQKMMLSFILPHKRAETYQKMCSLVVLISFSFHCFLVPCIFKILFSGLSLAFFVMFLLPNLFIQDWLLEHSVSAK